MKFSAGPANRSRPFEAEIMLGRLGPSEDLPKQVVVYFSERSQGDRRRLLLAAAVSKRGIGIRRNRTGVGGLALLGGRRRHCWYLYRPRRVCREVFWNGDGPERPRDHKTPADARPTSLRSTPDARQRGRAGSNAGTKTQIRCRTPVESGTVEQWNSGSGNLQHVPR